MGRIALLVKVVGIGVLALLLLIPLIMTHQLINERQSRRQEAITNIAQGWGGQQTVSAPIVVVPYKRSWTDVVREVKDGRPYEVRTERSEVGMLRFPLDQLDWSGKIATTEKARGIHKARLYSADLQAQGRVTIPARFGITDAQSRYEFGEARMALGIADPRGLRTTSMLDFGITKIAFVPGSGDEIFPRGVSAPLGKLEAAQPKTYALSFSMELAGAESFGIAPLARETTVNLTADWAHPSFFGTFLPAGHDIRAEGFNAKWRVSQFAAESANRLANCEGVKECRIDRSEVLGVSFIEPVGVYQQLDRATKYGFLFVGLMFAAFFLFELLRQLAIHPIQYGLVGLALAIFFVLLTALSEHIAFILAYLIATAACVGLVTYYVVRVLGSVKIGLAFGGGLAALYGALYMLLNAEDYALLAGAVLLFVLLAGVMVGTRRIDWYKLTSTTKLSAAAG